ncbi:MAG: helix-turn-helix domain-containing protein [Clostridiales bacterium]|jgi:transcriptional regulator with XRE-family HTH domain|nr:helix-turn-helix domain-containing protein [Clostridiales bacterium]
MNKTFCGIRFDTCTVGERLKELRAEKGIGQNKLARDLDLSNASISYWENGLQEPGAAALFKLARYFGVSADYILGLSDY